MPIMLQATQRKLEFNAYGNYPCSRDTFKAVIEFEMLKSFSFSNVVSFSDCKWRVLILHNISGI